MSNSRQDIFSGTKEVEAHLQLDVASLETYLKKQIPDYAGPLSLKRFKRGL